MRVGSLKRFSRSEVKGQGHSEAKHSPGTMIAINLQPSVRCASGGGIQIDGDGVAVEADLLTDTF